MTAISVFKNPTSERLFLAAHDAVLARWPVPFETMYVQGRFGKTHLIACGPQDAPPLVLLHGFCGTPVAWFENIADLARGYRCYCLSALGDIGRSVPTSLPSNQSEVASWLTEVFDELKIEKPHVVGHSFGGFLSLILAVHAPDRIGKFVPIAPAGLISLSLGFWLRSLGFMIIRTPARRESYVRWLYAKDSPRSETIDSLLALAMEHVKPVWKVGGTFSDEQLRKIRSRGLLLVGDNEGCFNPKAAVERVKRLVPSMETRTIPNAGHALPFEKTDIVNSAILAFLA